ncbi:phage tail tape measure protein [Ancylobacter sp. G4_0304]|uniref:phage tail tape measure protein n=1 Tax=Ancylobacter sp. G4_0304 TaxID=3114289 RepID=UPI0039C6C0EF
MTDLDVALRVRLLADLGSPARRAARDVKGIERAVDDLKRAGSRRAPDALAAIPPAARKAKRDILDVRSAARQLQTERPGVGIEQSLRKAGDQARKTERDLMKVKSQAREINRVRTNTDLKDAQRGLRQVDDSAGLLDRTFVRLGGSVGSAFGALLAFAAPAAIIAGLNQIEDRVTALDRKYASLAVTAEMRDPKLVETLRQQDTSVGLKYGMTPEQVQPLRNSYVAGGLALDEAEAVMDPSSRAVKAMDASPENISQTVLAMLQNLKVPPEDIPLALDMIAKGTKKGRFEADSVARFLPQYGAAYQGMGYTGLDAVAEINALAQIVRQGSGTPDAAGTNLDNLLQKVFAPDARKNFAEKGVDLEAVRARAKKEGKSYVTAILEEVDKLTNGGDPFLVSDLFGDMQVLGALRAVIPNLDQFEEWRKEIRNQSAGTIEQDWNFLAQTPAEQQQKMGAIAQAGRDDIAKEWWQPLSNSLSRLDAFIFNNKEFNRQNSLEVTNPEEFKRREQNQRRSEGVAAQRDMSAYDTDRQYIDDLITASKIEIRKMRERGEQAGDALNEGLKATGAKAVDTMNSIMRQIEDRGNVTISPQIAPQAPATVEPMRLRDAPAAPAQERRAAAGGARTVAQTNHITINGAGDPQAAARAVEQRLARLGSGSSSLFDTVG